MRKIAVVLAAAAALVGASAWAVMASSGGGSGITPLNCMDSHWRTTEVSTSSTTFATVPGFTDFPSEVFPASINVSALVSGAPVEFRILATNVGDQTYTSHPGVTRFVPSGGGPDSFAYQWVDPGDPSAEHVLQLRLQWRSPTGSAVHLFSGDMVVDYSTEGCQGSG